ncbi:MAG: NAD(P)/FAD-dependent oxidoreductase [Bacteroidetes bacterium]|nr:NAD(P)/FAD-dependent oxidoreductase [Bacteroidota bacterium]
MKIAIIGAGAAGFFAALEAKKSNPQAEVVIYEKTSKYLGKVKISGGGRCNVTNACFDIPTLAKHYPRGEQFLRKCFYQFNSHSTMEWFESRNVPLHTYPDLHVFPKANDSQVIIDCLINEAKKLDVSLKLNEPILKIQAQDEGFLLEGREHSFTVDRVIVTTGGQPKRSGLDWLEDLGHQIVEPLPSLFTFNMPTNPIRELMGTVIKETTTKIEGTKLKGEGPLLITHWGMSGPAILMLSAWGARILAEKDYNFAVLVNWLNDKKEEEIRTELSVIMADNAKMISNQNYFPITNRFWLHLLQRAEILPETRWKDLGKKQVNKLVNILINDRYEVQGKTTFKEEFVTAGGVSLKDIDPQTMESKKVKGLFFAGEIMDIDGITGGFNFQAAWTTGFIAGRNCGS